MYRACWIDQPNQPDYTKLVKHDVTAPIFDGRWLAAMWTPQTKGLPLEYLKQVRNRIRGNPGAFFCAQGSDSLGPWPSYDNLSGSEWADWVYETFQKKIAPGTSGDFPVVHLNPETDNIRWQMTMLRRWRAHSPKRVTVWTPIAHKAEIFKAVADEIANLNIIVGPQCYVGNMERVESANEVLAWERVGIPRTQIMPFLDGQQLGHWWGEEVGSIVFTQNRLP